MNEHLKSDDLSWYEVRRLIVSGRRRADVSFVYRDNLMRAAFQA
jgi:hypothetical protein